MWKGGAEAVTIQGKRVVSTTGIKCEGNAVLIQGRAYPQPYTISAIGNPAALEAAVLQDDYLAAYRRDASPAGRLGRLRDGAPPVSSTCRRTTA